MPASATPAVLMRLRPRADSDTRCSGCRGMLPLYCHASVALSKAAACRVSSAIHRLNLDSRFLSRSGPCNSMIHMAASVWMRSSSLLFLGAVRDPIFFRLALFRSAVLHDGQKGACHVPFDRDVRYIHVRGDFSIAIAGAVREVYLACAQADGIQHRFDAIQALLGFDRVFGSGFLGYQRSLLIDIFDGHLFAQVRAVAPMLIDGQVIRGVPQERFLVHDRRVAAVHMKAQHGLLYQILGVLPRPALAP